MERSSGILMPVFSLPSPYGIGTLGKGAYEFVDFLAAAGQHWWQVLPLGPTGYGDSPYQSFSGFAGNPYFIDPDLLAADGLLTEAENAAERECFGAADAVDYGALYSRRFALLEKAAERGRTRDAAAVEAFAAENPWLEDYALFMALKRFFGMKSWTEWPEDVRLRRPQTLARLKTQLSGGVWFFSYIQFLFFRQWNTLRAYARAQGVRIIGDLPIYPAPDSADVWAEPECFLLDAQNTPTLVSGVPPDYFSEEGQLWGNPLYDWDAMRRDGFGWWVRRVGGAAKLFDAVRFDHFRGLESFWAVPSGDTTAGNGHWMKGPGMELIGVLKNRFPDLCFIAEDLGNLTPAVRQLLADSGWPGMKVLQFAFDSSGLSDYLPHTYPRTCVCCTGTHDNTTLEAWRDEAAPEDVAFAKKYLGVQSEDALRPAILRAGMASVAALFIAPLQDWLGLGADARINTPGTGTGNWRWRVCAAQLTPQLSASIAELTRLYGRDTEKKEP